MKSAQGRHESAGLNRSRVNDVGPDRGQDLLQMRHVRRKPALETLP